MAMSFYNRLVVLSMILIVLAAGGVGTWLLVEALKKKTPAAATKSIRGPGGQGGPGDIAAKQYYEGVHNLYWLFFTDVKPTKASFGVGFLDNIIQAQTVLAKSGMFTQNALYNSNVQLMSIARLASDSGILNLNDPISSNNKTTIDNYFINALSTTSQGYSPDIEMKMWSHICVAIYSSINTGSQFPKLKYVPQQSLPMLMYKIDTLDELTYKNQIDAFCILAGLQPICARSGVNMFTDAWVFRGQDKLVPCISSIQSLFKMIQPLNNTTSQRQQLYLCKSIDTALKNLQGSPCIPRSQISGYVIAYLMNMTNLTVKYTWTCVSQIPAVELF